MYNLYIVKLIDDKDYYIQSPHKQPNNIMIEQAILGALLNDSNAYDNISDILLPFHFFDKINQQIYESIAQKLNAGLIADVLTLMNSMSKKGVPSDYIVQLAENSYPIENIRQYADIIIELSIRRNLMNIGTHLTENAIKENINVRDQITFLEKKIFDLTKNTSNNKTFSFYTGASEVLKITDLLIKQDKSFVGLNTGFIELNNILGGLQPGEIIILAGRPSVGKTALSTNIAVNVALDKSNGTPVLIISLEMSYEQLCSRIISSLSNVSLNAIMHAKLSTQSLQKCIHTVDKFREMPLYIYDASFLTVGGVRSLLRNVKRQYGIGLIILDYLQLLDSDSKTDSREQEISKISRSLKLIAKELNLPIIALSQMSRDVEKRKENNAPKLSDLRGSGAVEQDADKVLFLYRAEAQDRNCVKVLVAKNRNGVVGSFDLYYDGEITTFSDLA